MKKTNGTPYFKDLSRKDYVVMASRIIKSEGVGAISIRRIATELGCSSASMYRYFKNLDELLFYAQLDALNEYILELSNREKEWKGIWDMYFGIWRAYATEAFKKPEAIVRVSPLIKEMLEIPGYYDRDYLICRRLVEEKEIAEENARKLNHVLCTLFLGYFKFVQENAVERDKIQELVEQYIAESVDIAQIYTETKLHKIL